MKKQKKIFPAITLLFLVCGYCLAEDIIARLGMDQNDARYYILSNIAGSFENGPIDESQEDGGSAEDSYQQMKSFRIPYVRLLPAILKGDKAGAALELCEYVKLYVNSTNFMEDYQKRREAAKPTSEPWRPDAEMIKNQRESVKELEKQLPDLKKNKNISPEIIAAYEKGLIDQKKTLADWEDPHPNLTRWEKTYPEDPSPLIRKKLQEYLTLVATVDFNAKLTTPDKYKKVRFENPVYEKQSLKWKACFRAGKEVNDVTIKFVKEWLKGEIISKEKNRMPDYKPVVSEQSGPSATVVNPPGPSKADTLTKPVKEKKSLLNKLKKATGF